MQHRPILKSPFLWSALVLSPLVGVGSPSARAADELNVRDFLPSDFVTDGSVSYQREFQRAIDAAAAQRKQLVVPPITFLVEEGGFQLRSGLVVSMQGTVFILDKDRQQDGQVFAGKDVTDVTLSGGHIVGHNAAWPDGVNIRGIYITGASARIRIHSMNIRDLSSNGIGVFGTAQQPIRDVVVRDVFVENCCNRYPDYLSGEKWEEGSQREDQGLIALYEVEDFLVAGCRFDRSRSDGTHFYRCRRGQITNNRIYRARWEVTSWKHARKSLAQVT